MASDPIVKRFRVDPAANWSDHCTEFVSLGWERWTGARSEEDLEPLYGPCVVNGRTADGGVHRELRFWDEATRTLTVLTYDDLCGSESP